MRQKKITELISITTNIAKEKTKGRNFNLYEQEVHEIIFFFNFHLNKSSQSVSA